MSYLSRNIALAHGAHSAVSLPEAAQLALPEKVLQFGTGVLLRGLPDYLIDKANRQGIFNGRIVVVKSTARTCLREPRSTTTPTCIGSPSLGAPRVKVVALLPSAASPGEPFVVARPSGS